MVAKYVVVMGLVLLAAAACQPSNPSDASRPSGAMNQASPPTTSNPYRQFEHKVVRLDSRIPPEEAEGLRGGIHTHVGCVIATSSEGVTLLELSSDLEGLLERRLTEVFIAAKDIKRIDDVEWMFAQEPEERRPNWPCMLTRT